MQQVRSATCTIRFGRGERWVGMCIYPPSRKLASPPICRENSFMEKGHYRKKMNRKKPVAPLTGSYSIYGSPPSLGWNRRSIREECCSTGPL